MFFFLSSSSSSSSSDGLVQICLTLSWWFLQKTAAFSTEQCTSPSLFSRFEVSRGGSNWSLKNYGFLSDAIFSSRVRMHTDHLATKLIITQDCWIGSWCAGSVWREPGPVNYSSAWILHRKQGCMCTFQIVMSTSWACSLWHTIQLHQYLFMYATLSRLKQWIVFQS